MPLQRGWQRVTKEKAVAPVARCVRQPMAISGAPAVAARKAPKASAPATRYCRRGW